MSARFSRPHLRRARRRVIAALIAFAAASPLAAESYHVRLRYEGFVGFQANEKGCPGSRRNGFDLYEGVLSGDEDEFETEGQVVYRGVVKRTTNLDSCEVGPEDADGVRLECNVAIVGGGEYDAELTVYADRTEVYFQVEPRAGTVTVRTTTGGCEQSMAIDLAHQYRDEGDGIEHWIGPKIYSEGDDVGGPPEPGRYPEPPPHDPGFAMGSWTMDVRSNVLRAEAGGPYRVERGQKVRLDGSRSQGQIQSYLWTLIGEKCAGYPPHLVAEAPPRLTKQGAVVETRALCRIVAKLVVSDGTGDDEDYTEVEVVPRGFKTETEPAVKGRLGGTVLLWPCLHCQWGVNVCAKEQAQGASGHQIHSDAVGNWEGPNGFVVEPLRDPGGLWDGWWWVKEENLKMARAELVHQDLFSSCAATENQRFNQQAGATVADLQMLREAVAEHERLHTWFLDQKLAERGIDPAPDLEGFVGPSSKRQAVVDAANGRIAIADGELFPMTENDADVVAKMPNRFRRAGVVFLPTSAPIGSGANRCDGLTYDNHDIPSYAEMGVEGP